MKKLVNVLVTIAFAASFPSYSAFGVQGYVQSEGEAKGTKLLALGEELSAVGCGVLMGAGTFGLTYALLSSLTEDSDAGLDIALYGGVAVGYTLGSALGANIVGEQTNQGGSLWSSCVGAEIGALCAPSLGLLLGMFAGSEELAVLVLALGAPTGAVMGYNRSRSETPEALGKSSTKPSSGHGSNLTFLVPEVEVRRHGFSNSLREPTRGSPTFTYKVTLARLSF